jgi:hypothetical protein
VLGGWVLGGGAVGGGRVAETDGEIPDDGALGDGECFASVLRDAAGAFLWAGSPRLSRMIVTTTATTAIAITEAINTASRLLLRARRCVPGGRSGSVIDVSAGGLA